MSFAGSIVPQPGAAGLHVCQSTFGLDRNLQKRNGFHQFVIDDSMINVKLVMISVGS